MDDKTRKDVEAFTRKNHQQFGRGFTMLSINGRKSTLRYFLPTSLGQVVDEPFDGDFLRGQIATYDIEQTYLLVITNQTVRNGVNGVDAETLKMAFSDRALTA